MKDFGRWLNEFSVPGPVPLPVSGPIYLEVICWGCGKVDSHSFAPGNEPDEDTKHWCGGNTWCCP